MTGVSGWGYTRGMETYSTGEMSRITGVPVSTLRAYAAVLREAGITIPMDRRGYRWPAELVPVIQMARTVPLGDVVRVALVLARYGGAPGEAEAEEVERVEGAEGNVAGGGGGGVGAWGWWWGWSWGFG